MAALYSRVYMCHIFLINHQLMSIWVGFISYKHGVKGNYIISRFHFIWIYFHRCNGWVTCRPISGIWGISTLSSTVLVLVYIPTSSALGYILPPHILTSICCFFISVCWPFSLRSSGTLLWFLSVFLWCLENLSISS